MGAKVGEALRRIAPISEPPEQTEKMDVGNGVDAAQRPFAIAQPPIDTLCAVDSTSAFAV